MGAVFSKISSSGNSIVRAVPKYSAESTKGVPRSGNVGRYYRMMIIIVARHVVANVLQALAREMSSACSLWQGSTCRCFLALEENTSAFFTHI